MLHLPGVTLVCIDTANHAPIATAHTKMAMMTNDMP